MIYTIVLLVCLSGVAEGIVNGISANVADYPYQGSFRDSAGSHVCGCVLVHEKWAVTAGHCGGGAGYSTEWGMSNIGLGTVIDVLRVIRHPDYDNPPGRRANDISVLELATPASGTNISPIRMATYRLDNTPAATIIGWGATCDGCGQSNTLHEATTPIIANCEAFWGDDYNDGAHMCTWDNESGTCVGDSGSALIADTSLHGIASFSATECDVSMPSVFARIETYQPWVCGITGGLALGCTA